MGEEYIRAKDRRPISIGDLGPMEDYSLKNPHMT